MGTQEPIDLKTLGTKLRHAMEPVTQEPLPEGWHELVVRIERAVKAVPRSSSSQAGEGDPHERWH